jgi:hypothetical protein
MGTVQSLSQLTVKPPPSHCSPRVLFVVPSPQYAVVQFASQTALSAPASHCSVPWRGTPSPQIAT